MVGLKTTAIHAAMVSVLTGKGPYKKLMKVLHDDD
jgi:hypothetical protein